MHAIKILEAGTRKPLYQFGRVEVKDEGLVRKLDDLFASINAVAVRYQGAVPSSVYLPYITLVEWSPNTAEKVPIVIVAADITCSLIANNGSDLGWTEIVQADPASKLLGHPLNRLFRGLGSVLSDSSADLHLKAIAQEARFLVHQAIGDAISADFFHESLPRGGAI